MHPAPPAPPFPYLPPPIAGAPVGVPVGSVIAFAGTLAGSVPLAAQGWMVCDGTALSTTQYNELFAAIGYQWSAASGGDTFNLPDLQGYFLRGVDPDGAVDKDRTNRAVGSLQPCALEDHEHDYQKATVTTAVAGDAGAASLVTLSSQPTGGAVQGDLPNRVPVSKTETRPVNAYVYYIIKYASAVFPPLVGGAQRLGF
jgi:microcystin-dependent protein